MATLEDFDECCEEVKSSFTASLESLNQAEKVQFQLAVRKFQATKYYYGITRTERDSLRSSLRKFYDRFWLYGLGLLAVFWGMGQIVQILFNLESDPDDIWQTLVGVGLIAFIVVTFLEVKVTQLNATVTLLERDIMSLDVWETLTWSLIQHENRLRDDLKKPKEIPTHRIVNLIEYIIRAQILAQVKGYTFKPPIASYSFIFDRPNDSP